MSCKKKRSAEDGVHGGPKKQSTSSSVPDKDYDKLADAILKKQCMDKNARDTNQNTTVQSDTSAVEITDNSTPNDKACATQSTPGSGTQQPAQADAAKSVPIYSTGCDFPTFLQQLFEGESKANAYVNPIQPLSLNDGIPFGASIPLRIKQNIWSDQFIDLKTILPNLKDTNISIHMDTTP